MDVREKLVKQAISHFRYGVSHDIFSEPVTTYAKLAIEALEKEKESSVKSGRECGMITKHILVDLVQKYLQATTELYDYTTSKDLYVPTPCGFTAGNPIHMYCTPGTYGSLAKLFDSGSSHVEYSPQVKAYFEYATIGGVPIRILWTTDEYEEVCKNG